jgi:hypothetical protein
MGERKRTIQYDQPLLAGKTLELSLQRVSHLQPVPEEYLAINLIETSLTSGSLEILRSISGRIAPPLANLWPGPAALRADMDGRR